VIALVFALAVLLQAKDRPEQGAGPEVGKPAPAFKLKSQDGKSEVELAALKGKPALLIFGSYT
jgi:cytochrome c biogenesis protein CcmG, thiol:disulfide interchange protein DsbE